MTTPLQEDNNNVNNGGAPSSLGPGIGGAPYHDDPSAMSAVIPSIIDDADAEFGIDMNGSSSTSSGASRCSNNCCTEKWYIGISLLSIVALFVVSGKSPWKQVEQEVELWGGPASGSNLPDYPYEFVDPMEPSREGWKPLGGSRYTEYISGTSPYKITQSVQDKSDILARARRTFVAGAFQHAWKGYKDYAWGMDELKPVSKRGDNIWQGLATTMVDALDTLWVMGLKEEFWLCRDYIREELQPYNTKNVSVLIFETNIRSLGGMLSAYSWSEDPTFLNKALELAQQLIHAFDNPDTGGVIPFGRVNLMTGEAYNDHHENFVPTSQVGTLQLEFRWLDAFVKSDDTALWRRKVENIVADLKHLEPEYGLYPTLVRNVGVTKPEFATTHISFGANGDSFYEYLLKAWIQGGRKEDMYRNMYDQAIDGMHNNNMVYKSTPSGLTYLVDLIHGHPIHKLHHLTCFMGGLLALGAYTDPTGMDSERAQRDMTTSKALTYTCYQMYARQNTGLSPEEVEFVPGRDFQLEGQADVRPEGDQSEYGTQPGSYTTTSQNIMRPEVVESFYMLHVITGDPIYREWGWEVFQAFEAYLKTEIAYGEFPDVSNTKATPNDKMESFFLAETLKYLYLLFDPDSSIDVLDTHVFNTEGHPLPIFSKLKN